MKRGEIWLAPPPQPQKDLREDPKDIPRGKWRPVIILQDDELVGESLPSVTICPITSQEGQGPEPIRVLIESNSTNGLDRSVSWAMADRITTMSADVVSGSRLVGRLNDGDMVRVENAICMFLGLRCLGS